MRHLFTAAEAERVLGIPASTVRSWARRQRIWSAGINERGLPMYDRDDLRRLQEREVQVGMSVDWDATQRYNQKVLEVTLNHCRVHDPEQHIAHCPDVELVQAHAPSGFGGYDADGSPKTITAIYASVECPHGTWEYECAVDAKDLY